MKRILITVFLLTIISGITNSCVLLAQNMATESYNPYSPWHKADETGYYIMQRCEYCGLFITGTSQNNFNVNMNFHIEFMHPEYSNNYNGNNYSGGEGNTGSSQGNYIDYVPVVDLYIVAHSLEDIGICSANGFIHDYDVLYGDYIINNVVPLYRLRRYIEQTCNIRSGVDINTAIDNNYPFLALSRPNMSEFSNYCLYYDSTYYIHYEIITNNNITDTDIINGYYYVFQ